MNWTKVFESRNAIRAELVKNELLSNEINSVVLNKQDRNYLFGYHEVLVQEEHAAIAIRTAAIGTVLKCRIR